MIAAPRSFDERGTALLLALGLTAILGAIAAAVAVTARGETLIAGRFHQAREAHYAAEGALARALQDLASAPEWDTALAGAPSSFRDGDPGTPREVTGADRYLLCCRYTSVATLCLGSCEILATVWCAPQPLLCGRLGRRRSFRRGRRSSSGCERGGGALQFGTRSGRGPACRVGAGGEAPRWCRPSGGAGCPNAVVARDSVVK
jgi:hypothetical protein